MLVSAFLDGLYLNDKWVWYLTCGLLRSKGHNVWAISEKGQGNVKATAGKVFDKVRFISGQELGMVWIRICKVRTRQGQG